MKTIECRALHYQQLGSLSEESFKTLGTKMCFRVSAIDFVQDSEIEIFENPLVNYDVKRKVKVPYLIVGSSGYYILHGPSYEEICALMRDA